MHTYTHARTHVCIKGHKRKKPYLRMECVPNSPGNADIWREAEAERCPMEVSRTALCMYVCMCVCVCVCMYVCICDRVHIRACACMEYVRMHVNLHICMQTDASVSG